MFRVGKIKDLLTKRYLWLERLYRIIGKDWLKKGKSRVNKPGYPLEVKGQCCKQAFFGSPMNASFVYPL